MKLIVSLIALLLSTSIFSQDTGSVAGTISDKDFNNEPLAFANIFLKGTDKGGSTDIDGKFEITNVVPGEYVLIVSFLGYETLELTINVTANRVTTISTGLGAGAVSLDDVMVTVERRRNTEAALMLEVKDAVQVVSAISAEQISKGTDGNAAEAISRVPGVTVIDGRFVLIRGLSERYNNVLINNSVAPSTEIDKRTFSFDLIPTSALDKMIIYKTGSADKPGDFAGGVISITTSENVTDFNRIDVGFGYRANTSFKPYFQSKGSKTDFIGFDDTYRPLPSNFPLRNDLNSNFELMEVAAGLLPNNFNPEERNAFYDSSTGFSLGRRIKLGNDRTLGTINSVSYSNGYQFYQRQFNRYLALAAGEERPQPWLDFSDATYQNEVRISGLSNWFFRLNDKNRIKFKNLFNQISTNQTILRKGSNFLQRGDDIFNNYLFGYKARTIYIGQLEGDHKLNIKHELNWVAGYSNLIESEPDLRRFRTVQTSGVGGVRIIDPPSSNLFDTGRYFGELSEYSFNHGLNYTYSIERVKDDELLAPINFKAGYYVDFKNRTFDSRYFSYLIPGIVPFARAEELRQLSLIDAFSPANVTARNGWRLNEGTRLIDSYTAYNLLYAGYSQVELPINRLNIIGGVRVEYNLQELNAADDTGPITVKNPITSILPSLNIGYNLNEESIFRVAYSRTINRPEFREIAPFLFYDFINEAGRLGNPSLKTATIDNLDIRYELYPRRGETVSLGAFYKAFKDPIENVTIITTEQPQFFYANADKAFNYGIELEIRKSLQDVVENPFIKRLSTNINASYIISEVDLGANIISQDRNRVLQGQSPYIINTAISYLDENGLSANIIYNRFGDRIFSVGDVNFPTIFELSRNNIDVTLSKTFNKTTMKLGIQDLLNAEYRFFEDTNRDTKIKNENDNAVSVFKRGTLFSLNFSHNF